MNSDTYNSLQALFPVGLRPTEGMKYQGFAALSPTGNTAIPANTVGLEDCCKCQHSQFTYSLLIKRMSGNFELISLIPQPGIDPGSLR